MAYLHLNEKYLKLKTMRRELHISRERDLLRSGVEVRSGHKWSWYADSEDVFIPGTFYWVFAEIDFLDYDENMMSYTSDKPPEFLTYDTIMHPCFSYLSKLLSRFTS